MAKRTKESRIKAEKARLMAVYQALPRDLLAIAEGEIEQAAFMRIEMQDLNEDLIAHGWTEPFSQGKQEPYDRARPAGQSYNSLKANYTKTIDKLRSLLPKDGSRMEDDGFDDFVSGRDGP